MLSIFRRHVGWGLKVILTIIIISFVFFFGYSFIRRGTQESTAMEVGKEEIPYSKYQFFYNNQYQALREKFKDGEIPDFLLESIRQTVQRLLVQRSLTKQFASSLGFEVRDAELAAFLTKNKDFDPVAYKDFIQYFYRQNGFPYEDFVREDLLIQKFQEWTQKIEGPVPSNEQKDNLLPKVRLVDLWFQDFASKIKIKSLVLKDFQP